MQHVISFSGGLSSALTVQRVLDKYGHKNTHIVFMDTLVEDEDNYRFMSECANKWGKQIIHLCEGRTPRQVAEDEKIIPNQKIAPCTFKLKINPFRRWLKNKAFEEVTIHIGYDVFEGHRCKPTRHNYESEGWQVDFPLLWKPIEYRNYSQVVRDDWGIEPPRTYSMGFGHANCMVDGCFKMGIGDAIRLLINFPDRYEKWEKWETMMRDHPTREKYAIFRDQTNGEVKPLTLKELRERHEKETDKQPMLFDFDQQTPACFSCGVGDLISERQD